MPTGSSAAMTSMQMKGMSVCDDAALVIDEITGQSVETTYGIMTFSVQPFKATEPHSHQSEETWIVRKGKGYALIGSQNVTLNIGAQVTVPSNQVHVIKNDNDIPLVVLSFWWRENK